MEDRNFWSPRLFLLKGLHMDLLGFTPSELQHQGSSLKGTSGRQGGTEVSGIRVRAGGSFFPYRKLAVASIPSVNPLPSETACRHHI